MKNLDLDILRKKLDGKLTFSEEKEFQEWLMASRENIAFFNHMKNYRDKSMEEVSLESVPNTTDLFMKRLNRRSHKAFINKMLKYAAVVLLPLSIGVGLWVYSNNEMNQSLVDQNQINKEDINQTILITSNGNTYKLESGVEQAVVEDQGVKIRKYLRAGLKYEEQEGIKAKSVAYNMLHTSKGDDYQLELSDGTIVYLNGDSKLKYPVSFGDNERRVQLQGEAFFDVSKTGKRFVVEVDDMEVEVLGTQFNVMAYENENSIQTTLVSGKVKVSINTNGIDESLMLEPGNQAIWNHKEGELGCKKVDTKLYTSWVNGYFRFEDQRLEDVLRTIARWYDIKVFYHNPDLKNKRLSGRLNKLKGLEVISDMIEKVSDIEIEVNNKVIVVSMKE
ncbi:FecR family protein [Marinifilum sp. D737]|uniref:FecR family protein n=1 Tax=Marinifilum sp. D737 TaxID=2969628 RepID=UPI0022725AE4|nr:FecR domain-containing protein [Marinifilum sp. D737]MCY1633433.1 FecR domain-containing protein [Marinifilum sp. D737]